MTTNVKYTRHVAFANHVGFQRYLHQIVWKCFSDQGSKTNIVSCASSAVDMKFMNTI